MNQDRIPVREETEAVGHAVLLGYLWAGVTDLYIETEENALLQASERVWEDLVYRKMYITGGTGAMDTGHSVRQGRFWDADYVHEAAGDAWHLHNAAAYNETCGQIAHFMWSWRLLLATGKVRYADEMERQMYNGILSGIGLDGISWFYSNPLRCLGKDHPRRCHDVTRRFQPGRDTICCPSNMLRTIIQMHGCMFGRDHDGTLVAHHYAACFIDEKDTQVTVNTNYPWDSEIVFEVHHAPANGLPLRVRIPAWCDGATWSIDDAEPVLASSPNGYLTIQAPLKAGSKLRLDFPMPPRRVVADPRIEEARGQIAVMRGPVVYCLESPDLPEDIGIDQIHILRTGSLYDACEQTELGEHVVVFAQAAHVPAPQCEALYQNLAQSPAQATLIKLIPYYLWANRGISKMTIWLPAM